MSTPLQENLADEIVKDVKKQRPRQKKDLLVSAGYDETTASASPGRTIAQKGVRKALEARGFSEDSAKKVVESIMLNEKVDPNARLKATDQVFKVHGSYAPEKHDIRELKIEISAEIAEKNGLNGSNTLPKTDSEGHASVQGN